MERYFNNSDKNPNKKFAWSDDDKRYLKDNYGRQSNKELAKHFNKTVTQIANQASRQYLTRRCI